MEIPVASRPASFQSAMIPIHTRHAREFVDITDDVLAHLERSGITSGIAVVTSLHTTAAIVVNEHEPELLKDFYGFLSLLAPEDGDYAHNLAPCAPGEVPNAHAHCQALLLNTSASFPIVDGRISLGRYQRIFLVELDHARPRRVSVVVLGS
jgi:secondary thiamine-phosphate synthase enzyme